MRGETAMLRAFAGMSALVLAAICAVTIAAAAVAFALVASFDAEALEPVRANELKLTSTVTSGVQSVVAYSRLWDQDCHPLPVYVAITNAPTNGVASVKAGLSTLPESTPRSGSTGKCAGAIMIGRQVMYRSNPGFHGLDTVSYEEIGANGNRAPTTITVTVR
jgi:hypothetical protein